MAQHVTKIPLNLNLNNYRLQLGLELNSHVIALKVILKSIDDDSYQQFSEMNIGLGGKMPLSIFDKEIFRQQEINKAYISIIRSFQNFIDKIIAAEKFVSSRHSAEKDVSSFKELEEYVQLMEDRSIQEVSTDKTLSFPKKLDCLQIDNPIREILLGYSILRNNLEHHKDIASKDTILKLLISTLYINEIEVTNIPFEVKEGDILEHRSKVIERAISIGTKVKMLESEINEIVYTIQNEVAFNIVQEATQRIIARQTKPIPSPPK